MCHLLFDNISIIYYQKVDFQGDVSECHMNIRLVNNPLKTVIFVNRDHLYSYGTRLLTLVIIQMIGYDNKTSERNDKQ